jgi:hypothetical protein
MPGLWSPPAGSAHCEFGLRWALTLEDLKEWFREYAPSDAFLVALEKGAVDAAGVRQPTTSGYHYATCTLPQLVALLESARNQPSQLNFYEVRTLRFASLGSISKRPTQYIVDERPRRVGFDLEFELAEPTGRHLARAAVLWPSDYEAVFADKELFLRRTLVDVILPALSALAGRTLSAADCYVTDSSKPAKQRWVTSPALFTVTDTSLGWVWGATPSYHVVLDVILPDAPSRLAFHNWIQATFLKGDEAQRLKPLLDCSVYGNGRAMRLVGCNKVGKVPRLVPVASVGGLAFKPTPPFSLETPFTEELLATHMWTAVAGRAGCTELRLRTEAPAPRAKGQRSIPAKRKRGGPAEASLLVNCVEQDVLDALTELGFDVDACQGVSKAGDELRFRYRAVCPLCEADEHGSNFALWTRDGKLFVKSYSGDHAGDAPVTSRYTMTPEAFTALYGISFTEYHDRVLASLLGGDDGEAVLPEGSLVGPEILWRTGRPHDSKSFLTKIVSGGAVYRASFSPRRLDWRLLGVLPAELPLNEPGSATPRHIPAEAAFYIPTLARVRPGWTLVAPKHGTFNTREHTFLSLYTVLDEQGRVTHADGFRRVFGVTAFDILLGQKKDELGGYMFTPWATVFYDDLARWWADASRPMGLPPPSEDGVWKLPCCKERLCSRSEGCSLTTRAPWLFLRQLSLHNNT